MNRIYQGRVTKLEIPTTAEKEQEWLTVENWREVLWEHHQLFQDAVNYYIVALASLGYSPESKLTRLRELLDSAWENFEKKGQRRSGMGESLRRAWQLPKAPTLAEAVQRFTEPLHGLQSTAEKAAEFLLYKLGGDAAIQQGGREFLPMFCDVHFSGTYKLSAERRGRTEDERRLQLELHRDLSNEEIEELASSISLASVVNLQENCEPDTGEVAVERLRTAASNFSDRLPAETLEEWIKKLAPTFSLPKRRGGNIKRERADACSLLLAFPNQITKSVFQSTFPAPKDMSARSGSAPAKGKRKNDEELLFIVDGQDPIRLARGNRGFVFPGFTALPLWGGDGCKMTWKEFDIAAFKEALKVYNQFQQNLDNREAKLNGFALKLLHMDGKQAMDGYAGQGPLERSIHSRLGKLWRECGGQPRLTEDPNGEQNSIPQFIGDARIDRLRKIVNDDLAEEYRLTDGRRTPYGLRRRTMKG